MLTGALLTSATFKKYEITLFTFFTAQIVTSIESTIRNLDVCNFGSNAYYKLKLFT